MKALLQFTVIMLAILILGMLEARIGHGEEIYSAGQTYADPSPYYKGAN